MNNRGLPIVRSSKCSSFKKSQHASESSDTQAPEKSATVFLCHIISSLRRQYMCFQNMAERNLLVFCLPHISNESGCGAKTCDNFVYFPRASCLDTHLPMSERCPAVFHKCTSLQVSQVHKWKCQNIRLVRAREVVNALQMQSIRRWIYFLAKGSFWPKTAKCRRELCTSNESSLSYILDLHSNHGGLAIVIVTIIHHIYFQFHCHDHQP